MNGGNVAVIVYREDDTWDTEVLPVALTEDLKGLIHALRQQPSVGGTIGLAAVGDDFFVALRVLGGEVSVFLSDLTAAVDWPLARQILEYLDIPVPGEEDLDQVLPAGDMSIFADLGVDEMDLGALSGNLELFPDEVLASLASRLGFGHALERALDAALGRCRAASLPEDRVRHGLRARDARRPRGGAPALGLQPAEVPVGAVVLDAGGAIIGRGRNRREGDADPTAHAEIVAIRAVAAASGDWRLAGASLVVTLEPCTMCAGAISAARMARLVYGAADPRAGAVGSLWDVLRDRRLDQQTEAIAGVLEDECAGLLREFFAAASGRLNATAGGLDGTRRQ